MILELIILTQKNPKPKRGLKLNFYKTRFNLLKPSGLYARQKLF
jgi:hypothetical protein